MAQDRQPFHGFARQRMVSGVERPMALLDVAAVRAARAAHASSSPASGEFPTLSERAASIIASVSTPLTDQVPVVEQEHEAPDSRGAESFREPVVPVPPLAPEDVSLQAEHPEMLQSAEQPMSEAAADHEPYDPSAALPSMLASASDGLPAAASPPETFAPSVATPSEPVAPAQILGTDHVTQVPPVTAGPRPEVPVSAFAEHFAAFAESATGPDQVAEQLHARQDLERAEQTRSMEAPAQQDAEAGEGFAWVELSEPVPGPSARPAPFTPPAPPTEVEDIALDPQAFAGGGEIIRSRSMAAPRTAPASQPRAAVADAQQDVSEELVRAADPATAGPDLMALATHRSAQVRAAVAARPDLPATVVIFLSRDHATDVLAALLTNPRVPASTVRFLADHRDARIADMAVQRLRNEFR